MDKSSKYKDQNEHFKNTKTKMNQNEHFKNTRTEMN